MPDKNPVKSSLPPRLANWQRSGAESPAQWQRASDGKFYPLAFLLHGHEPEPRR